MSAPEVLEHRIALTLNTGIAFTSANQAAWVITLDGEESAYLNRSSFGDMRVATDSSFTGSLDLVYQSFSSRFSSTGAFSVDTIYVTTGRWGNDTPSQVSGTSVTFSAGDTNLISGTPFGTANIIPGGFITFFHRASSVNGDLDIVYSPGYDTDAGPVVSGSVNLATGQITLRFTKDDRPFSATAAGIFTQYATFNAVTTGAQRLEVREGFTFDQRLMVDLRPAGSSIVIGSPWSATKGSGGEGFYSGFSIPSIDLLMGSQIELGAESIDIRSPVSSSTAVGIGNTGVNSRQILVNAPLSAPEFVINPTASATGRGILQVSKSGVVGPGRTLSVEATDSDIVIENTLDVTNQTYYLRSANTTNQFRFVTTSPTTGFATGSIVGDTVSITMAAQGLSNTSPSVLDLNTKIRSLRASAAFSTPVAEAFPVSFAVRDADDLLVEAVPNAAASMLLQAGGTLTVNAAIDTSSVLTLNGTNAIVMNAPVSTTIGDIVMTTPVVTGQGQISAGSGYLKASVKAVSTTPLAATFVASTVTTAATLTGNTGLTVTIDGVALVNGDRVLVQGQTDAAENGIYRVSSPATAVGASVAAATASALITPEVRLATSGPVNSGLSNYSYVNGVNGVGATLTNVLLPSQPGTPDNQRHNFVLAVNGVTSFTTGDRILVKNQAANVENGIYYFASPADVPNAIRQLADADAAWDAADANWSGAANAAYGNGTAGVGATLTGTPVTPATGITLPAIDGRTLAKGDRILVKGFVGGVAGQNGVYQVTEPGSATVPWVLTRAADFDQSSQAEISNGQSVYVRQGTNNGARGFVVLGLPGTITVGTTAIDFVAANLWKLTRATDADSLALLDQFTSVRVAAPATDSSARGASNYNTRYFQANSLTGGAIGLSPLSYTVSYAYLSANAAGAITVDGVNLIVGDRVLVKNQALSEDNGAYTVRTAGTATTPWILQRDPVDQLVTGTAYNVLNGTTQATQNWYLSTGVPTGTQIGTTPVVIAQITTPATWQLQRTMDADTGSELPLGSTVNVTAGTTFANTGWTLATPGPVVLDTTKLVFTQSSKRDVFVASAAPLDGVYDAANNRIDGSSSSLILTIDGVQFVPAANGGPSNDRVLIKDQANAAENGIYSVAVRSDVIRQLADVRAATTTALTATYANNTPGVIASTLTGTGLLPLIDGVELVTGDRVLVQNYTGGDAVRNGVYVVTRTGGESGLNRDWLLTRAADMDAAPEFSVGTGVFVREGVTHGGNGLRLAALSAPGVVVGTTQVTFGNVTAWRLTRATDAATAGDLPYGFAVKVTNGATNAQTGWALGTDDPITLGTTPLDFYSSSAPFVKANGNLSITSTTGNLSVNALVSATGDTVRLTASGATGAISGTTRIAADRAELVAGGAISAAGSVSTLVATGGAGITFDNSGALELEAVQTSTGDINVSAGGRITATAVRAGGGATGPTTPTGAFDIDLVFGAGLPSAVQAAMRSAADRWEQIIVGDIAAFTDPVSGQLIDDIVVFVQAGLLGGSPSDGPGNALANAGPTGLRPAGSTNQFLPYTAQVGIDTADYNQSEIVGIMIHELGHALGFTETAERLNLVSTAYVWTGTNATREYRSLMQPGATGVPMETDTTQFGPGSLYAHWSEQVLGNELMTPAIDKAPNPLSRITVGAFEDMGYTVNYAAADVYPSSTSVRPAAVVAGDGNISLTARAGNIDVVALTAEQDKVTLSAASGTISGLSPAAAWLDWTAKVAPEQSFYNDFQKLSANLTGAGSIVVNNSGAVTLQDIRTADGNILVTAGGTLNPVSVVAGGRGTVFLEYSGVGGNVAAGTITSTAASPRVLRKDPVRVATTGNIALTGLQTIDGVALAANDRVLVRNQTNSAQNGVYVVAAGVWTRALDADATEDLPVGVRVGVTEGTQKGDYECVRGSSLTLGTTPLAFERVKILDIAEIAPVRLATSAPIATLATATAADGITLANGDRVLVRRQADATENGLYSFNGTGLVREADALPYGALVVVTSGTQAGGYMLTFAGQTATAGTTPLRFEPVAVAITSATGITDGSVGADKVDITAGTVRLVARDGSIGTVTNRLDLAADVLVASASASGLASLTTGANLYVGDTGDLIIANAFASGRVDVAAGGISGKLSAEKIETNAAGVVTLTAPGDITVGTIGSVDPGRRTTLVTVDAATGFLRNSPDGTAVTADKVRLVSRNFANFDVGRLDDVNIFSLKQTSAGVLQSTFNRPTPVTFDDVTTSGGDIAFLNNGTGDFLIGTGGINAGAFNGVSLSTGGQIVAPLVGNQGKIAGGGLVSLTADTTITALTSAGSLAAKITGITAPGTITLTETDSAQIGATGIDAGGVGSLINLTAGGQLDGLGTTSGVVKGDMATVTARTGIGLKTEVASLTASTASGVIVVRENDDLLIGADGIKATSGNVSISTGESATATAGSLSYDRSTETSGLITGALVTLDARKPGSIDAITKATEIAGSTVAGSFSVTEADGVTIGRAGISAGRTARVATATALAATYANNTPGLLPATLTATGNGALVADGVTLAIGELVLVKNQSAALQNGIYVVTAAGSPTTAWRLTRAVDADTSAELPNGTVVHVSEGSANGDKSFQMTITGALGTDPLTIAEVSEPGTTIYLASLKRDIQTPATYGAAEGRLAGDTVILLADGSVTARTDTKFLGGGTGSGSITIAEKSAVELIQLYSSALSSSGSGSVSVTAGGSMSVTDVQARGTRGTVSLVTTAGNVTTASEATVIAPESIKIDAAGRIKATDSAGTPLQAAAVSLTARGVDDPSTTPPTLSLEAEVATKSLSASAPNGSVKIVVETTDTLVLGAAASATAPKANLTAAGSVDISSAGGDVVVFGAPQARFGASTVRAVRTVNLPATLTGVRLTRNAPFSSLNASGGIDGVTTLRVGDRLLLSGQSNPIQNGIYVITSLGSTSSPSILTRAADSDTAAEYPVGTLTRVVEGTTGAGKVFRLTNGSVGAAGAAGNLTFSDETTNLFTKISTADVAKNVSYVVSATSGVNAASGTLGNMINLAQQNAANPANASLVFSSSLSAPILLTQELPEITRPLVIDGSQRLSPTTLARSTSASLVAVNGSGITVARNGTTLPSTAVIDGITVNPSGTNPGATISGLALGGFTKGAAVKIVSGTGTTVRNSSFGLTNANTKLANQAAVSVTGGSNATISGNTVGWSTAAGVRVTGGTGTTIRGNFIGTNAAGSLRFGNTGSGISLTGGTGTVVAGNTIANTTGSGVTVSGSGTVATIGSTTPADRNIISANSRYGVEVLGNAFASIVGNSISTNTLGGILSAASGTSGTLAAPIITNTTTSKPTLRTSGSTASLTLAGTVNGSGQRHIDVYASPATSTGNQGQVYLGRITIASGTTFSGTVTFASSLGVTAGWRITATATSTGTGGNPVTSAFSGAIAAVAGTTTSGPGGGGSSTPRPPTTPFRRLR